MFLFDLVDGFFPLHVFEGVFGKIHNFLNHVRAFLGVTLERIKSLFHPIIIIVEHLILVIIEE